MIYHPDKNNQDPYALLKFNDIKEAYEVLTSPRRKEAYLQERWLNKATGQSIVQDMITAPDILIKSLELNKAVAAMDVHRMGFAGIAARINDLLNDEVLEKLIAFNETDINQSIIIALIKTAKPLPFEETKQVAERLLLLAQNDKASKENIDRFLNNKKQQLQWDRYRVAGIIMLTICICLLIWYAGKQ